MSSATAPVLSAAQRAATVAELRRTIAAHQGQSGQSRPEAGLGDVVIPLPAPVAGIVPGGGLRAGHTVVCTGGYGLVISVLAAATAARKRCAVVGYQHLGLAAIAAEGGDLSQVAYVPQPGADPGAVVSVLLDGMDLVVVDPACGHIPPARARVLAGRARSAGAVLLVGARDWPHADVRLETRPPRAAGLERGYGRIAALSFPVRVAGKAFVGARHGVQLCQRGTAARTVAVAQHSAQVDLIALDRRTQKAG